MDEVITSVPNHNSTTTSQMDLNDYKMQSQAIRKIIPTAYELEALGKIQKHELSNFTVKEYVSVTEGTIGQSYKVLLNMVRKGILIRKGQYETHVRRGSSRNDHYTYSLSNGYNRDALQRAMKLTCAV